jgi:lipoprotein-anchoring transpeptidase ErfK/SrfK
MADESNGVTPASGPAAAPAPAPPPRAPRWRRVALAATTLVVALLAVAWAGTGYGYQPFRPAPEPAAAAGAKSDRKITARLAAQQRALQVRLDRLAPHGIYIVVDQTNNRLYLRKDQSTLLTAVCSAGSGMVLKEEGGKRQWEFDTPRGRFQVLIRIENPIWKKPDWAFVEDGEPIPKNAAERFEAGTLGEYAFYFGNGYMIHGTLYERLLGRSVTHGCIRLGRDDLRKLWAMVPVGTPIYIY